MPRGLDIGNLASIHLLDIVHKQARPSLSVDGVSKHLLDWHGLKDFFPQAHHLFDKFWSQTLDFKLFKALQTVLIDQRPDHSLAISHFEV